jgi:hypothetical protein
MKKKHLLATLLTGFVFVLLFLGGCKKELSKDSKNVKKPDLQMSNEAGPGKEPVLRQSPGLKFKVASKTIERILPQLKGVEQIKAKLREGLVKKKTNPAIASTSEASFTAAPAGNNNYFCRGIIRTFDGPRDWYLLNTYTWVYTYIGSTANQDIEFYLDKPLLPGTYGLYAENNTDLGYTNYLSLGDPYVGVTMSSGMLQFTDNNAADGIYNRLEAAYETHQATLFDAYDSWTDEQMDAHALSQGYDEWLPYKEFEAYFGLSSLRQAYQAQVDAYNANTTSAICNPRTAFVVDDEVSQTMLTSGGQLGINGTVLSKPVSKPLVCSTKTCTPRIGCTDDNDSVVDDTLGNIIVEKIIRLRERQNSNWFPSLIRVKGKVIIHKITGASSRRPYSTKISVRVYGEAFDGTNEYFSTNCGSSIGGYDTGFNALRRRFHRRENKKWDDIQVFMKDCGIFAEYNLPTYGMFYHRM